MQARVLDSALAPRPSRLGKPLLYSLAGHAVLVAVIFVGGTLFRPPPVELDQKPIQARLVRRGKPRDEKLLPRLEQPPPPPQKVEAPPPAPTPEPPAPAPEKPAVAIPGVQPKQTPKAAPQPGEAEGDRRKRLFGAFDKLSKARPDEETEGAEDGQELGDAAQAEGDQWLAMLRARIQRYYDVSQTLSEEERLRLRARVQVKISRAGEVIDVKLVKPSGNAAFDSAVELAVKRAQPFAPPPAHLRAIMERQGQTLEFSP